MIYTLKLRSKVFSRFVMKITLLVVAVTLIASGITYFSLNEILEKESYQSNMEILNQTKKIVEMEMQEIEKSAFSLALDRNVQKAVLFPWDSDATLGLLSNVCNLFQDKVSSSNLIDSIYLYSRKNGRVITNQSLLDADEFWDRQAIDDFEKAGKSVAWLDTREVRKMNGAKDNVISYMVTVPFTHLEDGILVINVKEDLLYNAVVNVNKSKLGNVAILSGEGTILSFQDKNMLYQSFQGMVALDRNSKEGYFNREINGEDDYIFYLLSAWNGWYYVTLTPAAVLFHHSYQVLQLSLIVAGAFLLIGVLLVLLLSREYRRPLRSLQKRYLQQEGMLREHFLLNLILGRGGSDENIVDKMASYGLDLGSKRFIVIALRIHYSDSPAAEDELSNGTLRERIYGLCKDAAAGFCAGIMVELDKRHFIWILNPDASLADGDVLARVREIATDARDRLRHTLELRSTAGIGGLRGSLNEIYLSCREAMEMLAYERIAGEGSILAHHDILANQTDSEFLLYMEEKQEELARAVREGSFEKAAAVLEEAIQLMQSEKGLSYYYQNVALVQFTNSIVNSILHCNGRLEDVFGSGYSLYYELSQLTSYRQIRSWFHNMLEKTARYFDSKRVGKHEELIREVTAYVQEHYAETFSLQEIADSARMNVSYFCKQFKELTGKTFNEYVTEVRFRHACQLLKETTSTVSDVAVHSGFGNKQNLIRAFKKLLGTTPSHYRNVAAPFDMES